MEAAVKSRQTTAWATGDPVRARDAGFREPAASGSRRCKTREPWNPTTRVFKPPKGREAGNTATSLPEDLETREFETRETREPDNP
jgi:hypothetical protein